MIIHTDSDIGMQPVTMEGAKDVHMKILIGPRDGSDNIIMRYFSITTGGNTPRHTHDYEHVVKIEKNKGIFVDDQSKEHKVQAGMSIFVVSNKLHQFKNPYDEPFEFLCIIPNPEKNNCCLASKI